jgi:hypothetical protein
MANKKPDADGAEADDSGAPAAIVHRFQREHDERLRDPARRKAAHLVAEAEKKFFANEPDEAIELLRRAADVDPDHQRKVDAYTRLRQQNARTGKVKLAKAINDVLVPRMRSEGFNLDGGASKWREGLMLRRTCVDIEQVIMVGRRKFGHGVALHVAVGRPGHGMYDYVDLTRFGLGPEQLQYVNQTEAEDALTRAASILVGDVLPTLPGSAAADA